MVIRRWDDVKDSSGKPVIVTAKMEYLYDLNNGQYEEYTNTEMAALWVDLLLRPGSQVWVSESC